MNTHIERGLERGGRLTSPGAILISRERSRQLLADNDNLDVALSVPSDLRALVRAGAAIAAAIDDHINNHSRSTGGGDANGC